MDILIESRAAIVLIIFSRLDRLEWLWPTLRLLTPHLLLLLPLCFDCTDESLDFLHCFLIVICSEAISLHKFLIVLLIGGDMTAQLRITVSLVFRWRGESYLSRSRRGL